MRTKKGPRARALFGVLGGAALAVSMLGVPALADEMTDFNEEQAVTDVAETTDEVALVQTDEPAQNMPVQGSDNALVEDDDVQTSASGPSIETFSVTPEVVQNVCPSQTASLTLSGRIADWEAGYTLNYSVGFGESLFEEGNITSLVEAGDGSFSIEVSGLAKPENPADELWASVHVVDNVSGTVVSLHSTGVEYDFTDCDERGLSGWVGFDPSTVSAGGDALLVGEITSPQDPVTDNILLSFEVVCGDETLATGNVTLLADEFVEGVAPFALGPLTFKAPGLCTATVYAQLPGLNPVLIDEGSITVLPSDVITGSFEKDVVQNVCPETKATAYLNGTIPELLASQHLGALLLKQDGENWDLVREYASFDEADGTYSLELAGLTAGKYRVELTIWQKTGLGTSEEVAVAQSTFDLTVEIQGCGSDDDGKKVDPEKKEDRGSLPKTGVSMSFALVAGLAAVTGGTLLRRKS